MGAGFNVDIKTGDFMKKLILERFAYSPESTEGQLFLIDEHYATVHICWTLERPWLNNMAGTSCIPEGDYWMAPHTRPGGAKSYIVWGNTVSQAPDISPSGCARWGILWHPANQPHELKGCIAPGLDRKPGRLLKSKLGFKALERAVKESFEQTDRMILTIRQRKSEAVI